jgi:WhiB family redox-sensing transcriptional regulator
MSARLIATPTIRLSSAREDDWRDRSACLDEDPDLFFASGTDPQEQAAAAQAKQICGRCPVRRECLDWAVSEGVDSGIWGGMDENERRSFRKDKHKAVRRDDAATGRHLAASRGDDVLWWLTKKNMPVGEVAERLNVTPRAVFEAVLLLVPPSRVRPRKPSALERVVGENSLALRTLHRMGRTHEDIARTLGTSQTVVSVAVRVLEKRDKGLDRIDRRDLGNAVALIQAMERRARMESGMPLSVDEVVDYHGPAILAGRKRGRTLREIADELGVNREAVRNAYKQMTNQDLATAA